MKQEECYHKELMFNSGEYYITCHICKTNWVMCDISLGDKAIPQMSNKGVGSQLSGVIRVEVIKN